MWTLRTAEGVYLAEIDLPPNCDTASLYRHLSQYLDEGIDSSNIEFMFGSEGDNEVVYVMDKGMEPLFVFEFHETDRRTPSRGRLGFKEGSWEETERNPPPTLTEEERAQLVQVAADVARTPDPMQYRIEVRRGVEGRMHEAIEGFIPVMAALYESEVARRLFSELSANLSDPDYALCRHPDGRWAVFEQGRAERYAVAEPLGFRLPPTSGRPQEMMIGPFVPSKWEEDER